MCVGDLGINEQRGEIFPKQKAFVELAKHTVDFVLAIYRILELECHLRAKVSQMVPRAGNAPAASWADGFCLNAPGDTLTNSWGRPLCAQTASNVE